MRIMLILLFVNVLAYLYLDQQLYFYGKSKFKVYHSLPIKVNPDYWGYDKGNLGFVITDRYDVTVVKKGLNKYTRSSEVFVNNIIKYGFNDKLVVVNVVDSLRREYSIILQGGTKPEIEALVDDKSDLKDITWIEVNGKNGSIKTMEWIRSFIGIGLFILVVIIGIRAIRVLLL